MTDLKNYSHDEFGEWYDDFMGDADADAETQYLMFKVGDEFCAAPLLTIREVIEGQRYRRIPNTLRNFKGIFNLRGEVVGVIDLRERLGEIVRDQDGLLMVFEVGQGLMAALVDEIVAVVSIKPGQIDRNPSLKLKTFNDYLIGIAKLGEEMVAVIEVRKLLTEHEIVALKDIRSLA